MRWQVASKFYTQQATSGILEESGSRTKSKYLELSSPHLLKTHNRAKERGTGGLTHLGWVWAGGGTTLLESQAPQTYPSPSCLLHPLSLLRQEGLRHRRCPGQSTWLTSDREVNIARKCMIRQLLLANFLSWHPGMLCQFLGQSMLGQNEAIWMSTMGSWFGVTEIAFQRWNDHGLSSPQHLFCLTFCLPHIPLASPAGHHFIIYS